MSTGVIGSVIIGVEATTSGLDKGFAAASSKLSGFSSKIGGISLPISGASKAIAGLGASLVAGLSVAGLVAFTKSSLDSIDKANDLAQRLGTTTEALAELQYAAKLSGAEIEDLNNALGKLNIKLGEAKQSGGPTADTLRVLGLDVKKLSGEDPAKAFIDIVGALQQVRDPATKAAFAVDLFGKSGASILNFLNTSPEKIAQLAGEARSLGLSFGGIDAEKVGAANDAIDKIGFALQGVGNVVAIKVAPYISAAGEALVKWVSDGKGVSEIVTKGFDGAATAVGFLADGVQVVSIGFQAAKATTTAWVLILSEGIAYSAEALQSLANGLPGVQATFGSTARAISDDLKKLIGDQIKDVKAAWAAPWASEGIKSLFHAIETGASAATAATSGTKSALQGLDGAALTLAESVRKLEESLTNQANTFGLSASEIELYNLKQKGATDEQLRWSKSLAESLKQEEANKKYLDDLKSQAAETAKEVQSPFEKYQERIAQLKEQLNAGLIDQLAFGKAAAKAGETFAGPGAEAKDQKTAALELGSAEARSAILDSLRGGESDPIKRVADATQQALAEAQRQTPLLEKIASALLGQATPQPYPI